MSRWDTGTRLPNLDTIKRNSKPSSLRTADAFPVVASLASAKRERSDDRKCVCCSQATNSHPPPPQKKNQGFEINFQKSFFGGCGGWGGVLIRVMLT